MHRSRVGVSKWVKAACLSGIRPAVLARELDVSAPAARPILQKATHPLKGCLTGDTALTIHLRRRVSFDLDYMTADGFSGDHLAREFEKAADSIDIYTSGPEHQTSTSPSEPSRTGPLRGVLSW